MLPTQTDTARFGSAPVGRRSRCAGGRLLASQVEGPELVGGSDGGGDAGPGQGRLRVVAGGWYRPADGVDGLGIRQPESPLPG